MPERAIDHRVRAEGEELLAEPAPGAAGEDDEAEVALAARVADEVDERHGVAAGELRVGDEHVEIEELVEEQVEPEAASVAARTSKPRASRAAPRRRSTVGIVVEEERPGPPDVRRVHALQTPLREGLFSL